MFPPKTDLPLDRAMRIYPHSHDTGAFFVAILEKRSEIKVKSDEKPAVAAEPCKVEPADSNGPEMKRITDPNGEVIDATTPANTDSSKRKVDETIPEESSAKRMRTENGIATPIEHGQNGTATGHSVSASPKPTTYQSTVANSKSKHTPFEEPFKYLSSTIPELDQIRTFYNISPQFPNDRFLVRNPEGTATKNIYYTTALAKDILTENEGKGMKFVHAGVKMFVKQDAPSPEVCPWRIQTDGLRIIEMWVGKERIVKLWRKETLRKLLIEMFPKFHGEAYKDLGEVGEQVKDIGMGCCVLVVEPTKEGEGRNHEDGEGLTERMVFPLWKSIQSLNLMLPKEERKAMLLRLFNDGSDLINLQQHPGGRRPEPKEKEKVVINTEESFDGADAETFVERGHSRSPELSKAEVGRRNSSSPQMDV